jgi:putative DNA primase/helicase
MSIRGAAIVELGELSVLSRADYNRVKQVITSQVDTYRDPFARCVASFHRQCIFIGSTNQDNWNRDPTGARRFLPVRVSGIDLAGFLADRDPRGRARAGKAARRRLGTNEQRPQQVDRRAG